MGNAKHPIGGRIGKKIRRPQGVDVPNPSKEDNGKTVITPRKPTLRETSSPSPRNARAHPGQSKSSRPNKGSARLVSGKAKKQTHKLGRQFDVVPFAQRFFEALDTPISLSCYLLLKNGEYRQLCEKSVEPIAYQTPLDFYKDYQAVQLLSKYPSLRTGIDTKAVALERFVECEDQCKTVNARFFSPSCESENSHVSSIMFLAQCKIAKILGPVPELSDLDFRFGPGANFGIRGETSVYNKLTADLESTFAMVPVLSEFLQEFPGWIEAGRHDVGCVPGAELTFVPKNAKTERPICIEPQLNGLFQKGLGSYIRDRLQIFGLDLTDQTRNRRLAQIGCVSSLATIDFRSASDTISCGLVLSLLPLDWVEMLDRCRSPYYLYDDIWTELHKFSSMGNGYTFELESLLFFALACSTCEYLGVRWSSDNLGVYGDDVIIPSSCVSTFLSVVQHCGFTINTSKSYLDGPFRESCGGDFFLGRDVNPFKLKLKPKTIIEVMYVTNQISQCAEKLIELEYGVSSPYARSASLRSLYNWCVSHIPRNLRCYGPKGFGDGHIVGSLSESPTSRSKYGWCGRYFSSYVSRAKLYTPSSGEGWPSGYPLYHAGRDPDGIASKGYTVRGRVFIRKALIFARDWADYGPWI